MHLRLPKTHADYIILPFYIPREKTCAVAYQRLIDAHYPLTGSADHGVSEALYLDDPDKNGVELYWDRPRESWPLDAGGNIQLKTEYLDLDDLLQEINRP